MVAGVVLMIFVILGSTVIHQGVQQLQTRQGLMTLFNHLDAWTASVKQEGFSSTSLSSGWHQKEMVDSHGLTYQLRWHVQEVTPVLKGITFQLQNPLDKTHQYEWKSGMLFQP